ncbi:mRNA degradation protein pet127, mitochondrial [Talaromyces islandicus]|uniref:mRNA degradation protein pet127, mitochondrial n=1 Tax=Talaromyces islandicus TaxID=28573 RepID=A0A0U1LZU4_TALIS|nr:mRNA degradation protein pet127, mitochondrial [Talaromyces islandicus]
MFQSALRSLSRPVERHVLSSVGSKRPYRFSRYYYAADITKRSFSSFVLQSQNEVTTHAEAPPPGPPAAGEGNGPTSVTNSNSNNASVDKPVLSTGKSKKSRKKKNKAIQGLRKVHKALTAQEERAKKQTSDKSVSGEKPQREKPHKKKHARTRLRTEKIAGLTQQISENQTGTLESMGNDITPLDIETAPVPNLAFGLDRVIFNPGVYHLRDPRTRIYNFDPYLDNIMPVSEFDFETLKEYITSSKDEALIQIARDQNKKYVGSSSSMTGVLSHFHYLLSEWRPVDRSMVSQGFPEKLLTFTRLLRCPAAMFLHYKDGVYAIDADKEFDNANILMNLGKSMEKLLTLPKEEFERYRKSSENKISAQEEQAIPESYHYSTIGDFVMRSQLDGYDPRLPGTGMFDLKTRAVVSIRMDVKNFHKGMGYEIKNRFGMWESFEREYYDMIRAAFLKYSLQVRVGRMDGIFVAFHNIERIFGFQYIPLSEMDQALHGQTDQSLGDREFQMSLKLWNMILNKATARFPKQSLRLHFETREGRVPHMKIFAEPVTSEEIKAIQEKNKAEIERYQRRLLHPELFAKEEEEVVRPPEQQPVESEADAAEAAAESEEDNVEPEDVVSTQRGTVTEAAESVESTSETATTPEAQGQEQREVMGMTLCITNRINGAIVTRPNDIDSTDKWTMDYELSELKNNEFLRQTYLSLKKRRERILAFRGEDETFYVTRLRKMAEAGRAFRAEQNRLDEEHGVSVYEPLTSISQNSK